MTPPNDFSDAWGATLGRRLFRAPLRNDGREFVLRDRSEGSANHFVYLGQDRNEVMREYLRQRTSAGELGW